MKTINQLKNGKASGPDKFTVTLAKGASESIAHPLMLVYNSSLTTGIFPDIWKLARVTQIYMSDPKTDLNKFRPISVISVFSRILERLAHDQMILTIDESTTCNQAAFSTLYSTVTSLISSTDFWCENIDHNMVNLTIFLGPKKAFDTVDYSILLKKL